LRRSERRKERERDKKIKRNAIKRERNEESVRMKKNSN